MGISPILILVFIAVLYLISSIKILVEYERGVVFRLGKLLPQPKGPGVILVFAPIDRIVRPKLDDRVPAADRDDASAQAGHGRGKESLRAQNLRAPMLREMS